MEQADLSHPHARVWHARRDLRDHREHRASNSSMIHLESLVLCSHQHARNGADWRWLAQMSCLTSLCIRDTGEIPDESTANGPEEIDARTILPTVLRCCSKLTHLDVHSPVLHFSDFARAFASPAS